MLLGLLSPRATHRCPQFPTLAGQKWLGKRGGGAGSQNPDALLRGGAWRTLFSTDKCEPLS